MENVLKTSSSAETVEYCVMEGIPMCLTADSAVTTNPDVLIRKRPRKVSIAAFVLTICSMASKIGYWTSLLKVLEGEKKEAEAAAMTSSGCGPIRRRGRPRTVAASRLYQKLSDPVFLQDLEKAREESRIASTRLYDFVNEQFTDVQPDFCDFKCRHVPGLSSQCLGVPGSSNVFCPCGRYVESLEGIARCKCGTLTYESEAPRPVWAEGYVDDLLELLLS